MDKTFKKQIKEYAHNYDITQLDHLYELTKTQYISKKERKQLAKKGYCSLFWEMNYDNACGKLTETGIFNLLPMVDKMEVLLGKKLWRPRSAAYSILLEHLVAKKDIQIEEILKNTVFALENLKLKSPNSAYEIDYQLAVTYKTVLKTSYEKAFSYWEKAKLHIENSLAFNPEQITAWSFYLQLIYFPYLQNESKIFLSEKINDAQQNEQNRIQEKLESFTKNNNQLPYYFAASFKELKDHLKWSKIDLSFFPNTIYHYWLDKSLNYYPEKTTRFETTDASHFFHNQGLEYSRIDLIEKAIQLYQRVIDAIDENAFEVYYVAKAWQDISKIYLQQQENLKAEESLQKAKDFYEVHLTSIKQNPSTHSHYADFLEYCYLYNGNIQKPSLNKLTEIISVVEKESKGFYSRPYLYLMRLALYKNNENEAIHHLTKTLILHELCIKNEVDELLQTYKDSNYQELYTFLQETKAFMLEITENYYLDTELKWEEIRTMSIEAINEYWIKRKEQLRKRKLIFTS